MPFFRGVFIQVKLSMKMLSLISLISTGRVRHVSKQYNKAVGSSMASELLEMSSQDSDSDYKKEIDHSQKVLIVTG